MITIITPTGDRPEAFELTRKWVASQTRQPDQWIVVDDGKEPLPDYLRIGIDYIRREPKEKEGHTLVLNMKEAVKHIRGDMILIFEDDDWYGPAYVETMAHYLENYDLVGESYARYYHLPSMKCRRIGNAHHASFCQTGFTSKILPIFKACLEGDPYIDARLWKTIDMNKYLIVDTEDTLKLHCSLKGLKGRKGIGSGHNQDSGYYHVDVGLQFLFKWVGEENAKIYMKHVGQSFISAQLIGVDRKPQKTIHIPKPISSAIPSSIVLAKEDRRDITVITLTGDRPIAFELCKRWMNKQIVKPKQWIVVDDGKEPITPTNEFEYYRREINPADYLHTLCLNLPIALDRVKYDKIIIMEDDDWYSPTYIDYMNTLLNNADLVGLGNLIFYYPEIQSYMEKTRVKQPAFAQTAFHKNIIPIIKNICSKATQEYNLCGKGLVDEFLWKDNLNILKEIMRVKITNSLKTTTGKVLLKGTIVNEPIPDGLIRRAERHQGAEFCNTKATVQGTKVVVNCDSYITIGMKGLPGRKGLTTHHDINNKKYKKDAGWKLLKSILKKDADFYMELFP